MARGWESKSIESQQADASRDSRPREAPLSPEARARLERRRSIELARARAVADRAAATHPAHRAMLEPAIAALDEQLRTLA